MTIIDTTYNIKRKKLEKWARGMATGLLLMVFCAACAGQAAATTHAASTTPAATPTSVPECDAAEAGASKLLYSHTFNEVQDSWGTIQVKDEAVFVHARQEEGVYRIEGRWFADISWKSNVPRDIILEADVQFSGGEEKSPAGAEMQNQVQFYFRDKTSVQHRDGDFYYFLALTNEGDAWIDKVICRKDEDVILCGNNHLVTKPKRAASFKPGDVNHVRLELNENTIKAIINGETVVDVNEPFDAPSTSFWKNSITAVPTFIKPPMIPSQTLYDIRIDNFCIYKP